MCVNVGYSLSKALTLSWYLAGDVGLVNMGMSQEDYMYMCTEVDYIIHAAAYVNLIYPYQVW